MAVSKAQQKAVHKYVKANYDRMELTVPKGQRDTIKAHAAARGESVNGFIGRAILETMERDSGGSKVAKRNFSQSDRAVGTVQKGAGAAQAGRVVYQVPAEDTAEGPQQAAETSTGARTVSYPEQGAINSEAET